jgi:hypothetical protein
MEEGMTDLESVIPVIASGAMNGTRYYRGAGLRADE